MKKNIACIFYLLALVTFITTTACSQQEKTITLDVKNMELTDVIRMIADQSGMNIIASKNVKGMVTINLQNVPVEKALEAILKVNGCGYVKEDDIIQVYTFPELTQKEQFQPLTTSVKRLQHIKALDLKTTLDSLKSVRGRIEADPKTNTLIITDAKTNIRAIEEAIREMDKELETKIYRLNYAKPQELQKNLQGIIPATEGEVLIDERTNSIIISASPLLLSKMDALISNWDKKIPQVLIEAKIIQVTLGNNQFLGIDWQYQYPKKHTATIGTDVGAGADGLPIPTGVPYVDAFKIGVLSSDDYEVTIRALEGQSDVNLISSPSIVTLDNTEAKILIGSSEPYKVIHYDDEGNISTEETKFVDVGIQLTVTPKIAEDGFITMKIKPVVSSPRKGTVTTDALAIDTTEADTIMTVKDGNTVVMGGLIKDDKETYIAKIPILGDIPLIKYAFRNKYTAVSKKEIIIFIRPRIISPDSGPSLGREEKIESIMQHADEVSGRY